MMRQKSYDVSVIKDSDIKFPLTCVVCNKSCENNFVINVHPTGRIGYWKLIFETTYEVNMNCHSECGEKVKSSSYRRRIIVFIMILVALISYIYFDLSRVSSTTT
jgi:hypothetical protein